VANFVSQEKKQIIVSPCSIQPLISTSHCHRFIYGLFNDAVSSSDYIQSNDRAINELEAMGKEASVACVRDYIGICLQGQRNATKNVGITGLQVEIIILSSIIRSRGPLRFHVASSVIFQNFSSP
jgi:hypothetical protein